MVRSGQKVYVTDKASRVLAPILEKYGLVLISVEKIEYPRILIDLPSRNATLIVFEDQDQENSKKRSH